jgi:hypothetical protein
MNSKLLNKIKNHSKPERATYSFRADKKMMDTFIEFCKGNNIQISDALDELVRSFVGGINGQEANRQQKMG